MITRPQCCTGCPKTEAGTCPECMTDHIAELRGDLAALKRESAERCGHCGHQHATAECAWNAHAKAEQADAGGKPVSWQDAISKAVASANHVFKESCDHTQQAIDYIESVMLAHPPDPVQQEAVANITVRDGCVIKYLFYPNALPDGVYHLAPVREDVAAQGGKE